MPSYNYLSVHAHFYQPPREDPFTGLIPDEAGAEPFKNWNERIFANCYLPNIKLGNFSKLSFNVGPTLANWMEKVHPEALSEIVKADRENVVRYGVGNAIAQGYHHTILPLANRRDKQTQVCWGIHEFERIFKRKPQGFWLPETAVDMETLEVLAENGIEFTILAPWQADEKDVDPRKAYRVVLKDHQSIKVFFYHSGLSSRISFDPSATVNADQFIRNFVKPEFSAMSENQWLLMASDGELYGHHQTFRDKFLSYMLNGSAASQNVEYSFPALQLQKQQIFPLIKIRNETSWSCHHGVQRWRGVCGCTPNGEWKKHLREALEKLQIEIDKVFVEVCSGMLRDPWQARDRYIEVISGEKKFPDWIQEQASILLNEQQIDVFKKIFMAELDSQRMFASCAWFFEDLNRIEPRNSVNYGAHAVWLVRQATGKDISTGILSELERSRSWQTDVSAADFFRQAMYRCETYLD